MRNKNKYLICVRHNLLDLEVSILTNCKLILEKIERIFKGFELRVDIVSEEKPKYCISVIRENDYYLIKSDEDKSFETKNESVAIGHVVRNVFEKIEYDSREYVLLHSSGFEYEGKGICFIGRTKAGKSSVITALTKANSKVHYMTDDVLGINKNGMACSYPKPIFLRNLVHLSFLNLDKSIGEDYFQFKDDKRYYFVPTGYRDTNSQVPLEKIVLLRREEGVEFSAKQLSKQESFVSIWKNMLNSDNIERKRAVALELAKRCKIFLVIYSNIEEQMPLFLNLLEI